MTGLDFYLGGLGSSTTSPKEEGNEEKFDKHMSDIMKTKNIRTRLILFPFFFFCVSKSGAGRMNKKDRKRAKSLEIMLYDQARKIYDCELMVINLDDHCVELAPKKPKYVFVGGASQEGLKNLVRLLGTNFFLGKWEIADSQLKR